MTEAELKIVGILHGTEVANAIRAASDERATKGGSNRCCTCAHFRALTPDDYKFLDGFGECKCESFRLGYAWEVNEIPKDGAVIENDEDWGWRVGPDFGCIHHHEAK